MSLEPQLSAGAILMGRSDQEAAIAAKAMTYDAEVSNRSTTAAVESEGEHLSDTPSHETFHGRPMLIGQPQTLIVMQGPQQAAFIATKCREITFSH